MSSDDAVVAKGILDGLQPHEVFLVARMCAGMGRSSEDEDADGEDTTVAERVVGLNRDVPWTPLRLEIGAAERRLFAALRGIRTAWLGVRDGRFVVTLARQRYVAVVYDYQEFPGSPHEPRALLFEARALADAVAWTQARIVGSGPIWGEAYVGRRVQAQASVVGIGRWAQVELDDDGDPPTPVAVRQIMLRLNRCADFDTVEAAESFIRALGANVPPMIQLDDNLGRGPVTP